MIKFGIKFFILFFVILLSFQANAQKLIIKGQLFERNTNKPVEFATVKLMHHNKGTISNTSGEFNFIIDIDTNLDTLIVSHLSYQISKHPINLLKNNNIDIYLKPRIISIKEVKVAPIQVEKYISEALDKIDENYPAKPMNYKGYFKETVYEDTAIIQQVEAIVNVYKKSYTSKKRSRIQIIESRINKNVKNSDLWDYIYFVDGPIEVLNADFAYDINKFIQVPVIKVNFLKEKHYKYYSYSILESNTNVLKIKFKPKKKRRRGVYKGILEIDKNTNAFVSLKYGYDPERISRVNAFPSQTEIELAKLGVYIPDTDYQCEVQYIPYDDVWVLHKVKNMYSFSFKYDHYKEASEIKVVDELYIIDINIKEVKKISAWKQLMRGGKLIDQLPETDTTFWNKFKNRIW